MERRDRHVPRLCTSPHSTIPDISERVSDQVIHSKAGLFSAVLTTFNVQSYLLLQSAPPDLSILLLQQISWQLESFSINPPFINSTQTPSTGRANEDPPTPVPRWAVWLNALWFPGLILSMTSASVCIMVKQWLNEYDSGVPGASRLVSRVRQYRLNNLRTWHVEDIVNAIPVFLQLALALFLSGLLILLWSLHNTVAAVASTLVGLLAVFTTATTLLPLFDHRCAYLSPQVRTLHTIWQPKRFAFRLCTWLSRGPRNVEGFFATIPRRLSAFRRFISPDYWTSLGQQAREMIRRVKAFTGPPEAWGDRKQTWQGRERSAIDTLAVNLDIQTLVEAYSATLHPDALSAATVCLMGFYHADVVEYFRRLHRSAREHFGAVADTVDGPLGRSNPHALLWLHIAQCALQPRGSPLSDDEATSLRVYLRAGFWPSSMQENDTKWAMEACNQITEYLDIMGSKGIKFVDYEQLEAERMEIMSDASCREVPWNNVLMSGAIISTRIPLVRPLIHFLHKRLPELIDRLASGTYALQLNCLRDTSRLITRPTWRASPGSCGAQIKS